MDNAAMRLDHVLQGNGQPVPEALRARLAREWQKVELLTTQIHDLERTRRVMIRESDDDTVAVRHPSRRLVKK